MYQVVKRDGELDEFKMGKITAAIDKAFDAKGKNYSSDMIDLLGLRVTADFQKLQPDEGTLRINGEPVHLRDSADAIAHGVGMVHQELMLIPYMSVAENVTLGQEVTKGRFRLDQKKAEKQILELSDLYGFDLDPAKAVYKLPIGVQQRVEIVKLLYRHANILI